MPSNLKYTIMQSNLQKLSEQQLLKFTYNNFVLLSDLKDRLEQIEMPPDLLCFTNLFCEDIKKEVKVANDPMAYINIAGNLRNS